MATTMGRVPRAELPDHADRTPAGIHIGVGVAVALLAVIVTSVLPAGDGRLVPVAAVVALVGAYTADPIATAAVTTLTYLMVMGFLVNQYGVLSWHGMPDFIRLMVICGSAALGLAIGAVRRRLRNTSRRHSSPRVGRRRGGSAGSKLI